MKSVAATIPDRLDRSIAALVERGWYPTREEVIRQALRRFVEAHQPELLERFVREDVEWGLRGRS
jgi:Arc/MetJ-type ribon-helix-helix transcriptional regulator